MSRYIKLEDVQKIFADENRPLNWTDTEAETQEVWDFDFYKSQIESLPTMEIIHCKDCKFQGKPANGLRPCGHNQGLMLAQDDNFCPYGKRKESGENE